MKQAMLIKAKALSQILTILHDLKAAGELHRWDIAHLLEQRQVTVGFDITGNPWVAIPIPSTADITALLTETNISKTRFLQLVPK